MTSEARREIESKKKRSTRSYRREDARRRRREREEDAQRVLDVIAWADEARSRGRTLDERVDCVIDELIDRVGREAWRHDCTLLARLIRDALVERPGPGAGNRASREGAARATVLLELLSRLRAIDETPSGRRALDGSRLEALRRRLKRRVR